MTASSKRALGLVIVTLGLAVYCALVMVLADTILPVHWTVDLVFYVVAGIVWIYPAYWVLRRAGCVR